MNDPVVNKKGNHTHLTEISVTTNKMFPEMLSEDNMHCLAI